MITKSLNETFEFISKIELPKEYVVYSESPSVLNFEIILQKGARCFQYKSGPLNPDYVKKYGYDLSYPYKLFDGVTELNVPKGTTKGLFEFPPLRVEGEILEIENSINNTDKKFHRIVMPIISSFRTSPTLYFKNQKFDVTGDSRFYYGLVEFDCDNVLFHLYIYKKDERDFLFIDSMSKIMYPDFKTSVDAIIYSYGMISGNLLRNEFYILQSDFEDFNTINGFNFKCLENTIESEMGIVYPSPMNYDQYLDKQKIDEAVFTNITTIAKLDVRFMRILKTICEANNYSIEFQIPAYFVALEAMSLLLQNGQLTKAMTPFKSKKICQKVVSEILNLVEKYPEEYFNNRSLIINRIKNINQPTNKDKFHNAFKLCGFKLNPVDEDVLDNRNQFLHGTIPFENNPSKKREIELTFISYRLHFLLTALIMKHSKFQGSLKNHFKFIRYDDQKLVDKWLEIKDEPLLREI